MLSPDRILEAAISFRASKALLSAVELGVFTELGKGPRSVRQMCQALNLSPEAAGDLLDGLVTLGFLNREGEDEAAIFINTRESGHFLDRNSPGYLGAQLERLMRS